MKRFQEIVIDVVGMTSERCERRIAEALRSAPGVVSSRASRAEGQAVVTADLSLTTVESLLAAVAKAGYVPGEVRFPE